MVAKQEIKVRTVKKNKKKEKKTQGYIYTLLAFKGTKRRIKSRRTGGWKDW